MQRFISISSTKIRTSAPTIFSACFEFHISKYSRIKYQISEALIESSGNVIIPNFRTVRELAYSINTIRGVLGNTEKEVRAGFLNAAGLLDEISHFLVRIYDEQENPGVVKRAYKHLEKVFGIEQLEKTLLQFVKEFPPKSVYKDQQTEKAYFDSVTSSRPHKEIALEELIMLHLSNINPAHSKIKELFDDTNLIAKTKYIAIIKELEQFFAKEKPFGPDNQPLLEALKKPILEHPDNIEAQLGFFKERWGIVLSSKFIERISGSFEFSKEEEKFIWHTFNQFQGKPNVETFVPEYKKERLLTPEERKKLLQKGTIKPEDYVYAEPEQFTPDTDWMPNVVLIAKNTYVWLDQLSKKYQREIKRLDQIPDEELDQLARWSFTSLWLIGVWERSPASKRIKQITGNLDAVSSAYSLYDYEIAHDVGGEEAFQHLNRRCWQRGIRLAGDMVPNHMGLFSKWVIEHPEYFIQSEHPPYPNYRFTGENLSHDSNIELRIEDGYWSRNDAAVVFQRIDRRNGEVRYVYHGNDGTSMPWNDTAQLNLLRADVREAVIQNIFHVARKFSVIRFDAAMTLAKKHFQRLWYPMLGTSGVPSRQDNGLSRSEFDAMFPNEFWREVVDRFNAEMPQTLLLAEAFWLMEGYFVRTLGMHRVYNSAFMHMLMKEENQKFRAMIKNTLEFNPEILKRYVNFMSNPDEQTAVEQFGKDDKYFGVATLMITLPGLPMFAHGQIEGFKEKYGMEYQRAYYNETPDEWLIRRHEHEIFPLTKKRFLFSQVHHFEFYDFLDDRGFVNEDVIAYSNRAGTERAVIFFHNKFAETRGYIKHSLPKAVNEQGHPRSITLSESLQIQYSENVFYRFRDRKSNLEYLLSGKDLSDKGMHVELRAFEYAVFTDFQEISDNTGAYAGIAKRLKGRGTGVLDSMLKEVQLRPFHRAIEHAFKLLPLESVSEEYLNIFKELERQIGGSIDREQIKKRHVEFLKNINDYFTVSKKEQTASRHTSKEKKRAITQTGVPAGNPLHFVLYHLLDECKKMALVNLPQPHSFDILQHLHLDEVMKTLIVDNGLNYADAENMVAVLRNLLRQHQILIETQSELYTIVEQMLNDFETANFLGVNQHNDIWYFNKEQFETLMRWVLTLQYLYAQKEPTTNSTTLVSLQAKMNHIHEASVGSEYQIDRLKELLIGAKEEKISANKIIEKGNSTLKVSKGKERTVDKVRRTKMKLIDSVKNITKKK
ncbi:MAG: alpha-amylase family glycosyl hydrolase [Bacteroidota bacterium]